MMFFRNVHIRKSRPVGIMLNFWMNTNTNVTLQLFCLYSDFEEKSKPNRITFKNIRSSDQISKQTDKKCRRSASIMLLSTFLPLCSLYPFYCQKKPLSPLLSRIPRACFNAILYISDFRPKINLLDTYLLKHNQYKDDATQLKNFLDLQLSPFFIHRVGDGKSWQVFQMNCIVLILTAL